MKSIHISEIRSGLDAALTLLGLGAGGYTEAVLTAMATKVAHFQDIRNRVK